MFEVQTANVVHEWREIFTGEDEEFEGVSRIDAGDRFEQHVDALAGAEVGAVDDEGLGGDAEFGSNLLARAAGRARGEEIVDDVDVAGEVEDALGFGFEIMRDGGDGIRLGEGMVNR